MNHTKSTDRKRVEAGHLSARLLTEYAEAPDGFDEDAVESIWAHLDLCDDCADVYDRIKAGDASTDGPSPAPEAPDDPADQPPAALEAHTDLADELAAPAKETPSVPAARPATPAPQTPAHSKVRWELLLAALGQTLRQWRPSRRAVPIAVAIVCLGATALVLYFFVSRPPVVARWASSEVFASKVPVQEIHVSLVRGGRSKAAHSEVNLAGIAALVVAVDLDRISQTAPRYDAVITDSEGSEVFRGRIDPAYFDDGRFMLQLVARHFRSGDYAITVDAEDATGVISTVARGTFSATR